MKYSITHPYLPCVADRLITGNYGEDRYGCGIYCSACGEDITSGEEYYDVNGMFFCMRCEDEAEMSILDDVRDEYIFER